MKKKAIQTVIFICTLFGAMIVNSQNMGGGGEGSNLKTHPKAIKKFMDMRFGMFIHWGPASLRGTEISWSRGTQVPKEAYDNLYKEFNPVLFDADQWVKAAKKAGMKYIVLTTRHHDGFSLWDSKYSEYDMANTPYGKGIIKDLVEACKKHDLVFGAYYSICDWWHEDYPVEYPIDDHNKLHVEYKDPEVKLKMDRYIIYMKNQLKELIEEYDPAFIWFDGEWEWAWTHQMGMDLYKYLRRLKDNLLINNRVDKGRKSMEGTTISLKFAGDYATPEQRIGNFDNKNPWESCITIAKQWNWKPNDELKSKKECIQTLVNTVGGDGNLLLNVGPMPDGRIELRQVNRLKDIGIWLKTNGEAVYATRGGPYLPTDTFVSTRKSNKIYIHIKKHPKEDLKIPVLKGVKLKKVYLLGGKKPLNLLKNKNTWKISIPDKLPDDSVSVIVLEFNKSVMDVDVVKRINY